MGERAPQANSFVGTTARTGLISYLSSISHLCRWGISGWAADPSPQFVLEPASLGALFAFGDALVTTYTMVVTLQDAYVVLLLLLFSLVISLTLVLSLAGMFGRAIAALMNAARRMATGRLDTPVPVESGDELAALLEDLFTLARLEGPAPELAAPESTSTVRSSGSPCGPRPPTLPLRPPTRRFHLGRFVAAPGARLR